MIHHQESQRRQLHYRITDCDKLMSFCITSGVLYKAINVPVPRTTSVTAAFVSAALTDGVSAKVAVVVASIDAVQAMAQLDASILSST